MPFADTIAEIQREVAPYDHAWFWCVGRSVPAAYNIPTNKALRDPSITHLWHVDDDMVLPKGVLAEMLAADAPAIACDYPVSYRMGAIMYDPDGKAFFTGAGCLLVKKEVYRTMRKPIWRSDVGWKLKILRDYIEFEAGSQRPDKVYGQQDVNFGLRLYSKGTPIQVCPAVCGQRRIAEWGSRDSNKGAFKITELTQFHRNAFLILNKSQIVNPLRGMMTVLMNDGRFIQTTPAKGQELFKKGLAKQLGHAVFRNWDVENEQIIKDIVAV